MSAVPPPRLISGGRVADPPSRVRRAPASPNRARARGLRTSRPGDPFLEHLCTRSLAHVAFPYLYLEASWQSEGASAAGPSAIVVGVGVTGSGATEIVGIDVGDAGDERFWFQMFDVLARRGLHGLETVMSDWHEGLVEALAVVYPDAWWEPSIETDAPGPSPVRGSRHLRLVPSRVFPLDRV